MTTELFDPATIAMAGAGALIAGFTTGFAGFGTGLVASGLWFHALPAAIVPPLIAMSSAAAQLVGVTRNRNTFVWSAAAPYLIGGVLGIPLGTYLLTQAEPDLLRLSIGAFLVLYGAAQLTGLARLRIGSAGGRAADGGIGFGGGVLGGFAGLSGPLPLVWLQMRGGSSASHRAVYQPFNLAMSLLAVGSMSLAGQINLDVLSVAVICLPVTLLGAWIGTHTYTLVSEATFRRIIFALLMISGSILVMQSITG